MVIERIIIARKYALAFFVHYSDQVDSITIEKLQAILKYIKIRKDIFAYINLSTVPEEEKNNIRKTVIDTLGLGYGFKQLMKILYRHKRIHLLSDVIKHIVYLYHKQNDIVIFNVLTSHPITDGERAAIEQFIERNVPGKHASINFSVNKNLISGIRIKSDSLFWENSIAKQLKDLERSLLEKAQL
ncbi:MAG: ATP synthase F1 subunit delta [Epsilonproteobacteria bacterium]|nr:ATP synthase F1 subunit delta [Campylobacterota bacterium]